MPQLIVFTKFNTVKIINARFLLIIILILATTNSIGQVPKLTCIEKERKSEHVDDPDLIRTCFLKNFKFRTVSYADYAGRYFTTEHEVFVLKNKKYIRITNSKVFNKTQDKLMAIINDRILQDYNSLLQDSSTKDCLEGMNPIPTYKMNDLEITFMDDEICFQVHWGLIPACRAVDGSIVCFKISEIKKYLN
jgi:hypothetical protein